MCNPGIAVEVRDFDVVEHPAATTFIAAGDNGLDAWFLAPGSIHSVQLARVSTSTLAQFLNALAGGIVEVESLPVCA